MNFFQLECFRAAYENSSFVEAACLMHVTSPTITYQISNLEDELKESLFTRTPKGVTPTQAGHIFYEETLHILNQYHSALHRFKHSLSPAGSVIRLGFTRPPDNFDYHAMVHRYRAENPDVVIDILEDMRLTEETAADVDLLFHTVFSPEEFPGYVFAPLCRIPFYATVGAFSKWAQKERIELTDLCGENFLVLDAIKNTKYQVPSLRNLKKLGIEYSVCSDINQLLYSIADNSGVSIYPSLRTDIQSGLKRIPVPSIPPLEFGLLYREKLSPAAADLLQFLITHLRQSDTTTQTAPAAAGEM